MSHKVFFLFSFLIVTSLACEETIVYVPVYQDGGIVGSWNWVRALGSFGYITPESEGYTRRLEFDANGNFSYYENDSLVGIRYYRFVRDTVSESSPDTIDMLLVLNEGSRDSWNTQAVSFCREDTLIIEDLGLSVSIQWFAKIKY